jgi:hypothetical protein
VRRTHLVRSRLVALPVASENSLRSVHVVDGLLRRILGLLEPSRCAVLRPAAVMA